MLKIERARSNDVESLLPLVQAYRIFYKQQPDPGRELTFVQRHIEDETSIIYLARHDGTAAGFTQIFKTFSTVHLSSSWILEDLFVTPQHRGAGIATALLDRAIKHAREDGASGMFLETAYDNAAAQNVYERAGWKREDRFYKYNAPLAR